MHDKRKYPRFDIDATIQFSPFEEHTQTTEGFVKDISAEGFCFTCGELLAKGTVLEVQITERQVDAAPLRVKAEVVWSHEQREAGEVGKKYYLTGVRILGIRSDDEARFAMLYCERVIAELKKHDQL